MSRSSSFDPISRSVNVSDIAILGVLGFGLYTLTKSGLYKGTSTVADNIGDISSTVTKTVSNVASNIDDITVTISKPVQNVISNIGESLIGFTENLPFTESYNEKVWNVGFKVGEFLGSIQSKIQETWYKVF